MKRLLTALFILTLGTVNAQDVWIQVDSINGAPRSVAASFVLNGEGYAAGGLDDGGFRRKMYSYNYQDNDWDDEASIGGVNGAGLNRGSASAFAIEGKGYVCLGQGESNGFFKDCWQYDPITETWAQMADFAGTARRQAVGFAIDDFGYVGTGVDNSGFTKDMYRYDPATNSWSQMSDFGGTARKEAVGFTMGGQAYVGTGDDGILTTDFWQYEPSTDTWVQKSDFPGTARKGAVGWGMFPQAFIATGEDNTFAFTKDVWEYNYYDDTWTQRGDFMGPGRSNAIAFVIDDIAFIGSGYNGEFMDDMYAYRALLGVDDLDFYSQLKLYPNPSINSVSIEVETTDLELHLYAINGQELTKNVSVLTTSNGFQIDRNNLESGSYFIRLEHSSLGSVYQGKIQFL